MVHVSPFHVFDAARLSETYSRDGGRKSGGLWGASKGLRAAASSAADEVVGVLRDLCAVRDGTTRVAGATSEDSGVLDVVDLSAGRLESLGSDVDAWWSVLSASQQGVWGWAENALEEMHEASESGGSGGGGGAKGGVRFRAVRQGPVAQCEHLLAQLPLDSEARDHACHHSTTRVLGSAGDASANGGTDANAGGAAPASGGPAAQVYDDASFYHALLKELLEDGSNAAGGGGAAGVAPRLKRSKRQTDNRRSKGRRLSYEVQPKLANFMFPEAPEKPVALAELFASVFGQRTSSDAPAVSRPAKGSAKKLGEQPVEPAGGELGVTVGSLFG